ncbi:MAG: hypothetical protein ACI8RZ_002519 [Myxococcota bacterium]|jgi:hypothetical protein
MKRRQFLKSCLKSCLGSAALLSAGLPIRAVQAADASGRKFLFVFNSGGWDPTRVFASEFSNGNVDMEVDAGQSSAGGISWVSHASRPSVDTFFETWHEQMLVLNGVMVRSIAHEICTMIAMTGSTSGFSPDWPARIAADGTDFTLPHLVLDGPSFPGDLGVAVARTGASGQLEALLSGSIVDWTDTPVSGISQPASSAVDRYLQRRAAGRNSISRSLTDDDLSAAYEESLSRSIDLKDYRYVMDFTGGADLASQGAVAVDALRLGLSRCVTLGHSGSAMGLGWDTHADNDDTQSALFEGLFQGLGQLMTLLASTPGEFGGSLADETIVVVLSEMGRTAQLNATAGKDHWPYTSMMLLGPGLTTDRVVGGYDEGYYGLDIDPASGDTAAGSGHILTAESVGATLLTLAGMDPAEHISDASPIEGILS